jgi:hypothetical protein
VSFIIIVGIYVFGTKANIACQYEDWRATYFLHMYSTKEEHDGSDTKKQRKILLFYIKTYSILVLEMHTLQSVR